MRQTDQKHLYSLRGGPFVLVRPDSTSIELFSDKTGKCPMVLESTDLDRIREQFTSHRVKDTSSGFASHSKTSHRAPIAFWDRRRKQVTFDLVRVRSEWFYRVGVHGDLTAGQYTLAAECFYELMRTVGRPIDPVDYPLDVGPSPNRFCCSTYAGTYGAQNRQSFFGGVLTRSLLDGLLL